MWEAISMTLTVIAVPLLLILLAWCIYEYVSDRYRARIHRLEHERDLAADELQDTIFKIAAELAASQRESTQAMLQAVADKARDAPRNK